MKLTNIVKKILIMFIFIFIGMILNESHSEATLVTVNPTSSVTKAYSFQSSLYWGLDTVTRGEFEDNPYSFCAEHGVNYTENIDSDPTYFTISCEGNTSSPRSSGSNISDGGMAFLFANYIDSGYNTRGSGYNEEYSYLQWAVWEWLGHESGTTFSTIASVFDTYHSQAGTPITVSYYSKDSSGTNIGSTISGDNYLVGPFTLGTYHKASDYSYTEPDGEICTLQDAFGSLNGGITKIVGVFANASGTDTKEYKLSSIPGSGGQFYISAPKSEIDSKNLDELKYIKIYYTRVHACANGEYYVHTGQDGLAANGTFVDENIVYTLDVGIPVKTNMTIFKYISKVDHVGENNNLYNGGTERRNKANKSSDPVRVERGDRITYTIELVNDSRFNTYVKVQDILPTLNAELSWHDDIKNSKWILVPANNKKEYTITLITTAETGDYTNTIKFIGNMRNTHYGNIINVANPVRNEDSDTYRIKEYNVSVDKYLYDTYHNMPEVLASEDGGTKDYSTFGKTGINTSLYINNEGENRAKQSNEVKEQIPVYAEYGDTIRYKIVLYNTNNQLDTSVNRDNDPYNDPGKIYVDIKDTLPVKYSSLYITVEDVTGNGNEIYKIKDYDINNVDNYKKDYFEIEDIMVPAGGTRTIYVSLITEEHEKDTVKENTVEIKEVRNINRGSLTTRNANNRCIVKNNATKTSSSDWYKINNYNASINKYISEYQENVAIENNNLDITKEEYSLSPRNDYTETEKEAYPLAVEKGDKLIYEIVVKNEAVRKDAPSTTPTDLQASAIGKATQVRPTEIIDYLDVGLKLDPDDSVTAKIYNGDGSINTRYSSDGVVKVRVENNTSDGDYNSYKFIIGDETILNPDQEGNSGNGDYIVYRVPVIVTESNMYLGSLKNKAELSILTNINHHSADRDNGNGKYHFTFGNPERKVKDVYSNVNENINEQQISSEFVRMKDLVISGYVWLDKDKDGYMEKDPTVKDADGNRGFESSINVDNNPINNSTEEKAMENIVVRLYQQDPNTKEIQNIRTVKTNSKGLYTFGFIDDSNSDYRSGDYLISNNAEGHPTSATDSDQRIIKATNKDITNTQKYSSDSELYNYYIEFEYDGIIYKSTVYSEDTNLDNDGSMKTLNKADGTVDVPYKRDSNAAEFKTVRDTFDSNFEIVGYNYAADGTKLEEYLKDPTKNDPRISLNYKKDGHNSYLEYDKSRIVTARSFIDSEKINTANNEADKLSGTKLLWLFKQDKTFDKPETDYLKFINLGLEERENVDISVVQDVYEVRNIINGEEMTYWYNQNEFAKDGSAVDHKDNGVSEAFESQFYMTRKKEDAENNNAALSPYTFKYYLADYNYKVDQYSIQTVKDYKTEDSELNSEITFRIKVANNSITDDEPHKDEKDIKVYTGINEVVEYFDNEFMNIEYNGDGTVKTINVKTKDKDGYLVDTPFKIADAYFVLPNGEKIPAKMEGYNTSNDVLTLSNNSLYNDNSTISGYNTVYIRPNGNTIDKVMLAEGENVDIIVKFIVAKDDSRNLKLGLKTAIAEIGAYSTYYQKDDGTYYAAGLVDKNSNPGNFGKEYDEYEGVIFDSNKDNNESDPYLALYEDDTYKTGINLDLQGNNERIIEGQVWDDARSDEAADSEGVQYIGDGIYGSGENPKVGEDRYRAKLNTELGDKEATDSLVPDVGVKLVESIRIPQYKEGKLVEERIYEETIKVNDGDKSVVETRTSKKSDTTEEGKYALKGYIPGEYTIKFSYGDKYIKDGKEIISDEMATFTGQDYKSTTYQAGVETYADNAYLKDDSNKNVEDSLNQPKKDTDKVLQILETEGLSDAKDDEIRRLETVSYSETLNNNKTMILRGINSINKELQTEHEAMVAETVDFLVRAEKENSKTETLTYAQTVAKFEKAENQRHPIENIDFGLQYRPEQQVALNKFVKNLTITTSDSNTGEKTNLVDAKFNEYYGVVVDTDLETGITKFLSYKTEDGEDVVLKVKKDGSNIAEEATKHGLDLSGVKKNKDGKYQVIIAGTELDKENSIGISNLQFVANDKDSHDKDSNQGFLYINVDNEIMQGAEINVEYLFTGHNISEIDRVSKNLSELRFEKNEAVKGKTTDGKENYNPLQIDADRANGIVNSINLTTTINKYEDIAMYSGAATARNDLFNKYYRYEVAKDNSGVYQPVSVTDKYGNPVVYRIRNNDEDATKRVTDKTIGADGYYGKYLGTTYYTGEINNKETVAELRIDKILDYVDNNMVFEQEENNQDEGEYYWRSTNASELVLGGFISPEILKYEKPGILKDIFPKDIISLNDVVKKVDPSVVSAVKAEAADLIQQYSNKAKLVGKIGNLDVDVNQIIKDFLNGGISVEDAKTQELYLKLINEGLLLDSEDVAYNTDTRSNLALLESTKSEDLSTDVGSEEIVNFLTPRDSKATDSFGKVKIITSKVISADEDTKDMIYENVGEIIEYTSVSGRVTNLNTTLGNVDLTGPGKGNNSPEYEQSQGKESDTAAVEKITLTPPTGLSKTHKIINTAVKSISYVGIIVAIIAIAIFGTFGGIKIYRKRRIK